MPKVLFLTQRFPYPPNKGDKIRALNILEHLAQRYEVFLGCLNEDRQDSANLDWVTARGIKVYCGVSNLVQRLPQTVWSMINGEPLSIGYFRHQGLLRWAADVQKTQRPDLIYVFSSAMAQYVAKDRPSGTKLIMDFVDVDAVKWRQYAATKHPLISGLYALEARRLLAHDRGIAQIADASLFVSQAELDLFKTLAPEASSKVHAISNGVDTSYFAPGAYASPSPAAGRSIVFVGVMDYWPNVEAVRWFAKNVFPVVRKTCADVTFQIVGSSPSLAVRALAETPGVEVTGAVADIRPYLQNACVVVTPLRIARGIQNKVLEGMAMAKPLVTTPDALEGISARHNEHLLVANSAESFTQQVVRCLTEPELLKMGQRARAFVVENYSWSTQLKHLDAIIAHPSATPL